ncbi:MAG: DNA-3-methyladenine glycosylase 2 family protein [Alphaproteobacteria bacterium]|nr:DNA-3-methyladenine glycosylase 2 family protein [Alphaproteobacteria bacterium]MDX5370381.1 DNA-3-methyladenine glycosylase 2 family protein [Alphaproteobacteria bacterium]MDX5464896.1 DNA-3-methyladenine glycosylase 2 family protein [Alphaproteobacteria bacterium]
MSERFDSPEHLARAVADLAARDAHLARAVEVAGPPRLRAQPQGFPALLRIITEQQLSVASAKAIWARIEAGLAPLTPETLLARDEAALRAMGFSGQKVRYARDLAEALVAGRLDLDALHHAEEEEAVAALTAVKGIGRWTAEVYLLFGLRRADVLPAGDLALQAGLQSLHGLDARPAEADLREIAEAWRPWRGAAALTLWTYYRHVKGLPPAAPDDKA